MLRSLKRGLTTLIITILFWIIIAFAFVLIFKNPDRLGVFKPLILGGLAYYSAIWAYRIASRTVPSKEGNKKEEFSNMIGWYNEKEDKYLCSDCFSETQTLNKEDYKKVKRKDLDSQDCTCSICGAELAPGKSNEVDKQEGEDEEEEQKSKDEEKGNEESDTEEEDLQAESQDLNKKSSSNNDSSKYMIIFLAIVLVFGIILINFVFPIAPAPRDSASDEKTRNENQSPESPQKKQIKLGKKPKVKDNIRWEVTDVTNEGDDWGTESTNGKFLKISLQTENLSTDLKTISINDEKLIRSSESSFDCWCSLDPPFEDPIMGESLIEMSRVNERNGEKACLAKEKDLKPNIPEDFYYIFEVPKNLEGYTIEFSYSLKD